MYKVYLPDGREKEYSEETTLLDISKEFVDMYGSPIVAAILNGEEKDLQVKIANNAKIKFIELASTRGMNVYCSSLIMVFYTAILESLPGIPSLLINTKFANSFYCEAISNEELPSNYIDLIKNSMSEIIENKSPIFYQKVSRSLTEKILKSRGEYDRLGLIEQLDSDKATISSYSCRGVYSYFFSPMVPNASYLKHFDVQEYDGKVILSFPTIDNINEVPKFVEQPKFFKVLVEAEKWGEIIGCRTINELNCLIKKDEIKQIIQVSEALHEKKIVQLADTIHEKKDDVRMILVSGPSSSGKTTFVERLNVQLRVNGLKSFLISMDNYFLDRHQTPKKANGEYDLESVAALDLDLFNDHIAKLLAGEEIVMPRFNFIEGKKEFDDNKISLKENQLLIIEGIHAFNDRILDNYPSNEKINVYISPLIQLRMDKHNLIEGRDIRLLRRMVRDSRTRGYDARDTVKQWGNVVEGEHMNITPFQDRADIIFNTALIYELAVLKKYVEPLLEDISNEEEEYTLAKRLLNFLVYVNPIDDAYIPSNSLLREFIGSSWFHNE